MRKLVMSLVAAGTLPISAQAAALPTQIAWDAIILNGPDLSDASDAGVLLFELDADTGRSCRYYLEWLNENDDPASVGCFMNEAKTHGAASCFVNASQAIDTLLMNDRRLPCTGWDGNGQASPVFLFLLGESSAGYLNGILQFSASSPWLSAVGATPYP